MRKYKYQLLFVLLIVAGSIGSSTFPVQAHQISDWLTYTDESCGFSFQYPLGSSILGDQGDTVRIGLPIMPGTNLIEKYVEITCSADNTSLNLNLPSVGEVSTENINGIDFQVQSGGEAGAGNLYQATRYSIQKENQYISLTFVLHSENGSNSGLPEFAETERDVFAQIMSTFKFSSLDLPPAPLTETSANFEGQIAYVGVDGNVYLLRGDAGKSYQVTSDASVQEHYAYPEFSPNGENLAFVKPNSTGEGPLFVFNTNNSTLKQIVDNARDSFQWFPNGSKLGYIQNGALYTLTLTDFNSQKELDDVYAFSWSPSGEKIIFIKNSDSENPCRPSYILNYQSKKLVKIENGYEFRNWSPNSQWVVTVLACYEFGGMSPVNTETGQVGENFSSIISWSSDSIDFTGHIGGGYGSETPMEPIVSGLESSATKIIHGNISAEWSPKENIIATYGTDGLYFLLPDTETYQKILDKEVTSVYWSPSSQQLLLTGVQPEVYDQYLPIELMIYDRSSNSIILNNIYAGTMYGKFHIAWGKLPQTQIGYTLSGNIHLSDQSPLAGVAILLDGRQSTTTNGNGNFRIEGVSAGEHVIEPKMDGYGFTPQSQQLEVQADVAGLEFQAEKVSPKTGFMIAGRVTDENLKPLSGAQIILNGIVVATTDQDGRYRIENKEPRKYTLGASLPGYSFLPEPFEFTLDKDKEHYDFKGHELNPTVQLAALEVTQGLQDLDNNVPLVAGRPTYVRAYITSSQSIDDSVLVGRASDGREFKQLSVNKNIKIESGETMDAMRITLDKTLYFEIPPEWIIGDLDLELSSSKGLINCGIPSGCPVKVHFQNVPRPEIRFFLVDTENRKPAPDSIDEVSNEIFLTYPVSGIEIEGVWKQTMPAWLYNSTATRNQLDTQKILDGCVVGCKRIYVGILAPLKKLTDDSLGNGLLTAVGHWQEGTTNDNLKLIIPHELGHVLGRPHTPYCDASNNFWENDYPKYKDGHISAELTGRKAVYGIRMDNSMQIIKPDAFDLMTYCFNPNQVWWPSDFTYKKIMESLQKNYATHDLVQDQLVSLRYPAYANPNSAIVISGLIDRQTGKVEVDSLYTAPIEPYLPQAEGAYKLTVSDDQGNPLATTGFDPGFHGSELKGSFVLAVNAYSETAKITISKDNVILFEKVASANKPEIKIVSPNGGEVWQSEKESIVWSATDVDQDPLQFAVQYSRDGGKSWDTLATNITENKLEIPLGFIPGASEGLIRVLASDGFYTSIDSSDAFFSVPGHAPKPSIAMPENERTYRLEQWIVLQGGSYDIEDGQINDSSLLWTSEKGAALGTGSFIGVPANQLQAGTHTIVLTATDKDGNTASASVQIIIEGEDTSNPGDDLIPDLLIQKIQPWIIPCLGGLVVLGILAIGTSVTIFARQKKKRKIAPKPPQAVESTAKASPNPSLQLQSALELSRSGKYKESNNILQQLVQADPNNANAWLYLGFNLANQEDLVSAEKCLLHAKKLGHPKADEALAWLKKKGA